MLRTWTLSLIGMAGLAALALGCSDSSSTTGHSDLDPVRGLIGQANGDAQSMEQHASMMVTFAASRQDYAGWASDAAMIRANARSLRLIADAAAAILHDPGADPDSSNEPRRVLADGLNLERLGEALIAQADAMEAHVRAMRDRAQGDAELLAAIDSTPTDIAGMRRDGRAAIERGAELVGFARRVAATTGQRIE